VAAETVTAVLALARDLLLRPEARTAGVWPRASALLGRQALEMALDSFWRERRPGVEACSTHAQLLCLREFWPDREEAGRIHHAWTALTRACHHHPYELAPTAAELEAWFSPVDRLAERVTPSASRPDPERGRPAGVR
jgi:hypothetical protein